MTHPRLLSRFLVPALAGLVLLVAGRPAWSAEPPLAVVASFSILADLVRQVGGDRVEVTSLVGPDGDAHTFEPSPKDAGKLAGARLIAKNGLGLDGWMDRLVKASGTRATVVVASRTVTPYREPGAKGSGPHIDPHAWQDVGNARRYVVVIRDALAAVDPDGRETYGANADRYLAELDGLERYIRAAVEKIPPDRRKVITTHDAFGYFGRAYGFEFLAPQALSTEAEPTARDVARIVRQIRDEKVPAVFIETISDPRLMNRIATESGAKIGGKLWSDALSPPDGPAGTYVAMMRHNMDTLVAALGR